jgi:hypothetical protein
MRGFLEFPAWRQYWEDETRDGSVTFRPEFIRDVNSRSAPHIGLTPLEELHREPPRPREAGGEAAR